MSTIQLPLIFQAFYCEPMALERGHFYSLHNFLLSRMAGGEGDLMQAVPQEKPGKFGHQRASIARPALMASGEVDGRYYFTAQGRKDVAVIPWNGVMAKNAGFLQEACMGMVSHDRLSHATQQAMAAPEITKIVFDIGSPGGQVVGTPELANLIRMAGESKATYAFVDYMMASAAVYAGIQAQEIYMTPSASIGSIGTILGVLDDSVRMEKEGLKLELFTAGKHKAIGRPGQQLTADDRKYLQETVNNANQQFVSAVKTARPGVAKEVLTDAKMYTGEQAVKLGLVDGLVSGWEEFIDLL
ncbi:hypothetical protein GCM10023213_19910 [Prosthecobacter algae]|uniref:Peptidase S49 domain-containing protein n=2 Tax=Prosthecobacter algae TaxID=1144682 RepID=A0ABP9P2K5_9BACT